MQERFYKLYASVKKEEALPEDEVCVVINMHLNNHKDFQTWFTVWDNHCNKIIYETPCAGNGTSVFMSIKDMMKKADIEIAKNNEPPKELIVDGVKYIRVD